jgi:type II secretory ATPase GspE/PulE/Tfp pilus assembly ATPase PilB-like protein
VLAQRLVRKLCTSCAKDYNPAREEYEEIASDFGKKSFEALGPKFESDMVLKAPGNCENCSGTGYKGRMGIHEMMEGTPTIKGMIKKAAATEDLFKIAAKEGMTTLKQDGILKVFGGFTDIREVRRVCIT